MSEKTLPAGGRLIVTKSPFVLAKALNDAVFKELRGMNLPNEIAAIDLDLAGVMANPAVLAMVIDRIIAIMTSKEVENCLFACAERAVYENIKVTRDLFDDAKVGDQSRRDFYPMCAEIVKENCGDFFAETFSWLKTLRPTVGANPA